MNCLFQVMYYLFAKVLTPKVLCICDLSILDTKSNLNTYGPVSILTIPFLKEFHWSKSLKTYSTLTSLDAILFFAGCFRSNKRYYYRNKLTGESQWEYPQPDIIRCDEAMDISTTPPPPPDEARDEADHVPPPPRISSPKPPPPPIISESGRKSKMLGEFVFITFILCWNNTNAFCTSPKAYL